MNIKTLFLLVLLAPVFVVKGMDPLDLGYDLEEGRTSLEQLEKKCHSFRVAFNRANDRNNWGPFFHKYTNKDMRNLVGGLSLEYNRGNYRNSNLVNQISEAEHVAFGKRRSTELYADWEKGNCKIFLKRLFCMSPPSNFQAGGVRVLHED